MAIEFRRNIEEYAVKIGGKNYCLCQYADDTSAFTYFSQQAFNVVMSELNTFEKHSGLKINYDKTTIYRIGSLKNSDAQLYSTKPIAWSSVGFEMLGIQICHKDILETNSWRGRHISLFAKIAVINSLVGSLFVHKMMVLPNMLSADIAELHQEFSDFIWNGNRPKIPLAALQMCKKSGGANLVDLQCKEIALKCSWINILYTNSSYANIVYEIVSPELKEHIFRCNLHPSDIHHVLKRSHSEFWFDVLKAWASFNYSSRGRRDTQILWWNSDCRIENKPYLWKDAYSRGLVYFSDLIVSNRLMNMQEAYSNFGLDVMRYNALISSVPKSWKQNPAPKESCICNYDIYKVAGNMSQIVYQKLNNGSFSWKQIIDRWEVDLECDLSQTNRYSVFFQRKGYHLEQCPH